MIGQISASLAAMHRTVEDYDSMAKREIIKAKQEKAMMYVCSVHVRCISSCVVGTYLHSAFPKKDGWSAYL